MSDSENVIRNTLAAERDAQARFLAELVKVPSDNPPGDCRAHAERAAVLLEELGFEVERHPVPAETVTAAGIISATNLVVRRKYGEGPVVALNAHGDVVPPGEGWTKDPYGAEVVDGWMYGRGVAVSKSDFATYTYALIALDKAVAAGAKLGGTIELHFTYDEEVGGEIGPRWLIDQGLSKPDLSIGAGFSYNVVTAHNGCLHLAVTLEGKSAHAAMPFTGHDALEAANAALSALYDWRKSLSAQVSKIEGIGSPQCTVGLIEGGINTNVVPDKVTFRLDRRMIPEENPEAVEAELRTLIEGAVQPFPGITVTIKRVLLAAPLMPLDGGERLTEVLAGRASEVTGETVAAKGVPLYTDARHYTASGIPTVLYGAGPHTIEEANAHRADERLPLDDLTKATEVIALTLYDLLKTT
ncbi:M20/M25/M40 family metallo-hydrolase [Pelagibius litoralis]|uniref:M20/M25/M40 family metallo-hydrolase n=1 Tax=Pelagibius litoralis TaxID=374515 RepID=A0A967C6X8_9PROT|nr:M20/M25/M40 family metallo-hydrolase [Pelagibius litoralis]NIA68696.1 M20/M25/M40 family metallo-hydrolase [Pelagibius litoralis]